MFGFPAMLSPLHCAPSLANLDVDNFLMLVLDLDVVQVIHHMVVQY